MTKRFLLLGTAFVLSAVNVAAQQQASTLERMTRSVDLVIDARLGSIETVGTQRRVTFVPLGVLRGQLAAMPELGEPEKLHCGSIFVGLSGGERVLIFADQHAGRISPRGGSRGIVLWSRASVDAVGKLIAATNQTERLRLVAAQLGHASPRVAADAALALPVMRGLEGIDTATASRITRALDDAIRAPLSGARAHALLLATARARPVAAAERAWSLWLDEDSAALGLAAKRVLLDAIPANTTVERAPLAAARTPTAKARIASVLGDTASGSAVRRLERLLPASDAKLRAEIARALQSLGVREGKPVERKRFRAILR